MSVGTSSGGKLSKSRIRKRSVRFGNPSLFTYHGCLYTIEGYGDNDRASAGRGGGSGDGSAFGMNRTKMHPSLLQSRPLIEGAEQAERLAAMVRVPPEQVPEGVLNLVRSHRPWIHHVRIVIEDPEDESSDHQSSSNSHPTQSSSSRASAKSGGDMARFDDDEQIGKGGGSFMISPTALAVESAASILAAEQHRVVTESAGVEEQLQQQTRSQSSSKLEWDKDLPPSSSTTINEPLTMPPSRTYLVLFEMCDEAAAEQLVGLLHGQPYTCLDESQVCSLYHVAAIHGDDGVSLMSPFFASIATKTESTPSNALSSRHGSNHGLEIVPNSSSASAASSSCDSKDENVRGARVSGGRHAPSPAPSSNGNAASGAAGESLAASSRRRLPSVATADDYNCAVCLERLDWDHLGTFGATASGAGGEKTSILTTVCKYVQLS